MPYGPVGTTAAPFVWSKGKDTFTANFPVVAITGMEGVGKTVLADYVAAMRRRILQLVGQG